MTKEAAAGVLELVPPEGGRIHIVRVPVRLDREWQEAINAAGPNTPSNYHVRKVGDHYPPKAGEVIEPEVILMNFWPNSGSWDRAIGWGEKHVLKRTNPRHVFAIGEHKPQLHRELGLDYIYTMATEECVLEGDCDACDVWWDGPGRGCRLRRVEACGSSFGWFAFLRK